MITESQFKEIAPKCKNPKAFVEALNHYLSAYDVDTKERLCAFLGQYSHETQGFTRLIENLNYTTPLRLIAIFPKYFKTEDQAKAAAGKPMVIANIVYANRMGNGDAKSGDGFKYCGRGLCHLTGRSNYTTASKELKIDLLNTPEILQEPDGAVLIGCWYWRKSNLNVFADKKDYRALTRAINGGYIGVEDRIKEIERIRKIIE